MIKDDYVTEHKDLMGFLLGPLRERPGMFLGGPSILKLVNFIIGYQICYYTMKNEETPVDKYFENPGFVEWFYAKHKKQSPSFWESLFLKKAKGDERRALQIYFKYLEEYAKTIQY